MNFCACPGVCRDCNAYHETGLGNYQAARESWKTFSDFDRKQGAQNEACVHF